MIIKSISYKQRKAFHSLPGYLLRNNSLEPLYTRFITGKNYDPEILSRQFSRNEEFRKFNRSNNICLVMDILSFHNESARELDDAKLRQIARRYVTLRSPRSICIAVAHRDKCHTHIHVLFSAIEYRSGKSIRISRAEFKAVKLEMEEYQKEKFPELSHSLINHEPVQKQRKINLTHNEKQMQQKGRSSEKQRIAAVLETAYKKARSKEAFYALAAGMGVDFYTRNGIITGVAAKRKHRLKTLGYTPEIMALLGHNLTADKRMEILKTIKRTRENHEKSLSR